MLNVKCVLFCPRVLVHKSRYQRTDNKLQLILILKLMSNSSSLNKGNHERDGVWISDLNLNRFCDFLSSCFFSLALVSIAKMYQKHSRQCCTTFPNTPTFAKNTSLRGRIFNSLLGIWKCGQTRSFVFEILLRVLF